MDSTLPRSRPLGQSLPLGENSWSLSICMLCRRSFHGDGSSSLRLFALGLRANKSRLMEPCCLGGSPSRFIDQARGVLLFVFFYCSQRLSLIFIFCFLICLFSLASPCGGVLFCCCCWCHVTCRLFSCLLLASVLVSCPRCVHR